MLVVHGFWSGDELCVWSEDPSCAVKSPSQALRSARPHPFALTTDQLVELVPGKPGEVALLLPSVRSAPLDSPELVRVAPRRSPVKEPSLLAWTVPVVRFDPAGALTVLALVGQQVGELRWGASLRYFAGLADFARSLADRGRALPALDLGPRGPAARWRPVLQGPDVLAHQGWMAAMPPVCRAEVAALGDSRGGHAADLVTQAVEGLVDAVVRERLAAEGWSPLGALPPRRGRRPKRAPVVELWLEALATPDGRVEAEPGELDDLARALAPWSMVGVGKTGPARASFRLSEMETGAEHSSPIEAPGGVASLAGSGSAEGGWRLELLLQSMEDPSLLVPADQVWTGGDSLRRWLDRPEEVLLAELGRASTLYPELAGALRRARPTSLDLDAAGAYRFLSDAAGVLDQAGFGVLVPSWWSRRRGLGLAASASTPQDGVVAGGRFSRDALVQFEWRLAIGDDPLTEDELASLAAAKAPLVRLRGEWVAVDPEQVRRGLDFLQGQSSRSATAGELIALSAGGSDGDLPLPVTTVRADGWLGDLLSGAAERSLQPVPTPDGLRASLRPYQHRGLSWLAFMSSLGLGACLADDMGLGKTIQLLALEAHWRSEHPDAGPTLLLCPMSLVGNWQREAARFTPDLRVYAHHGRERFHADELDAALSENDMVVTTYTTATRDIDELAGHRWDRLVLDEAQAVKNSLSRAAKAVRRLDAGHRVALTGTPMENRLAELWSIMDVLNPGVLGSSEMFRARYAIPIERNGQTEPAERLRATTRPYIIRRLKTDPHIIDDLPEKIEIKQHCHLTAEQASLYQSVVDEMMDRIERTEGIERRGNVLAAMTKLKQVCNHPAQLLQDGSPIGRRSGKVARLEEIVEEILAEGDRALLFTQFTAFAELLLPHLAARFDQDVLYLHGGLAKARRDEMVQRFQSDSGPSLFLLSLKAGGTGLNLTAANHVVHLDRWWNPAVEDQATDRAFRIGQRRSVQVRKFVCMGTIEERVDEAIEEKKALADLVISDGERWLTELSTDKLREVFALSDGAVEGCDGLGDEVAETTWGGGVVRHG